MNSVDLTTKRKRMNNPWSVLETNELRDIISQTESNLNIIDQDISDHPGIFQQLLEMDQKLAEEGFSENSLPIICMRYTLNRVFKNMLTRELFNREHDNESSGE